MKKKILLIISLILGLCAYGLSSTINAMQGDHECQNELTKYGECIFCNDAVLNDTNNFITPSCGHRTICKECGPVYFLHFDTCSLCRGQITREELAQCLTPEELAQIPQPPASAINAANHHGNTALMLATQNNLTDIVLALIDNTNPNIE